VICKHCKTVFERILPSVQHNIIKIIRERTVKKNMPIVEEKMRDEKELKKIKRVKDKDLQKELLDALREKEEKRLLGEQPVETTEEAPPPDPDAPATSGALLEPVTTDTGGFDSLLQEEEEKLREVEHEKVKDKPHLHTGLPYETKVEEKKKPTDRELLEMKKKQQTKPNQLKDFVEKKFKQKRTSLEVKASLIDVVGEEDASDSQ
jgi:hypothetical protein